MCAWSTLRLKQQQGKEQQAKGATELSKQIASSPWLPPGLMAVKRTKAGVREAAGSSPLP